MSATMRTAASALSSSEGTAVPEGAPRRLQRGPQAPAANTPSSVFWSSLKGEVARAPNFAPPTTENNAGSWLVAKIQTRNATIVTAAADLASALRAAAASPMSLRSPASLPRRVHADSRRVQRDAARQCAGITFATAKTASAQTMMASAGWGGYPLT